METIEQITICALKELTYYQGCSRCSGEERTKMCYTTTYELRQHLTDFRNMFNPRVQAFYQRYGRDWVSKFLDIKS
jgi:hypothetical protein